MLHSDIELIQPVPDHSDLTGQALDVVRLLGRLSDGCREVMAFDLDGFTGPEIAQALDLSEQRVRDLRKRARAQLRLFLDEEEGRAW